MSEPGNETPPAAGSSAEALPFEKALEGLQLIVKKLESGELTLEQALKNFEEGVRIARSCQQFLQQAEKRVEQLTRVDPAQGPSFAPFQE